MANQSNSYLKRFGDAGLLSDLVMNKRRITDLADAEATDDAVNKYTVDAIGMVNKVEHLDRMTSPNSPNGFTATSDYDSDSAWMSCSTDGFWSTSQAVTQSLHYTFPAGPVDSISINIKGIASKVMIGTAGSAELFVSSGNVTGRVLCYLFNTVLTDNITITFTPVALPFAVSNVFVTEMELNVGKTVSVHLPRTGSNAINLEYFNNVVAPLRDLVAAVYVNPSMESNTSPSGYVVTSEPSSYNAYNAFDYELGTNFIVSLDNTNTVSLSMALALPTVVTAFEIAARSDTLESNSISWKIVASTDDGNTYQTLFESIVPIPQTKNSFSIPLDMQRSYNTYRLEVTARAPGEFGLNCLNLMTTSVDIKNRRIINLLNPINSTEAVNVAYADDTYLAKAGGTMTGPLIGMQYFPASLTEAVSKNYVVSTMSTFTSRLAFGAAMASALFLEYSSLQSLQQDGRLLWYLTNTNSIPNPTTPALGFLSNNIQLKLANTKYFIAISGSITTIGPPIGDVTYVMQMVSDTGDILVETPTAVVKENVESVPIDFVLSFQTVSPINVYLRYHCVSAPQPGSVEIRDFNCLPYLPTSVNIQRTTRSFMRLTAPQEPISLEGASPLLLSSTQEIPQFTPIGVFLDGNRINLVSPELNIQHVWKISGYFLIENTSASANRCSYSITHVEGANTNSRYGEFNIRNRIGPNISCLQYIHFDECFVVSAEGYITVTVTRAQNSLIYMRNCKIEVSRLIGSSL